MNSNEVESNLDMIRKLSINGIECLLKREVYTMECLNNALKIIKKL